jgi:hypothetical protein
MVLWVDTLHIRPDAVIVPHLVAKVKPVDDVLGFLFQALELSISAGIVCRDA